MIDSTFDLVLMEAVIVCHDFDSVKDHGDTLNAVKVRKCLLCLVH